MTQFRTSTGGTRDPERYPNISFSSLSIHSSVGMKTVLFKGQSVGSGGKRYNTHLLFHGCEYSDVALPNFHQSLMGNSKDTIYFKALDFNKQKVKLFCSCDDARHTLAWPLYNKRSWITRPKRYQRVPGSTRPPRNPLDKALVCKHLHSLISMLVKNNMIV